MENSARLYNCVCCHKQVILCSHCDYGNIYCFDGCAHRQRTASKKAAAKRYQSSLKGRANNAKRQAEYRIRQATSNDISQVSQTACEQKVTHHGSINISISDSIDLEPTVSRNSSAYHCHCCNKVVSNYLRSGYIRYSSNLAPPHL